MSDLKRRYEMELNMQADDLQSLRGMLMTLLYDLDRIDEETVARLNPYDQVSGGYSGNHIMKLHVRPDVTHDSYMEQLNAYLDEKHAAESAVSP